MAKRMPYFKFFCSEWNDGDIVFEDYETQGVFINICSLYWSRECNLTKRALERKFPNNLKNILTLQEENILVINSDDLVIIRFLDQQAIGKDRRSSTSALNGAKGGRPKKPNKPIEEPNVKLKEPKHEPKITQLREDNKEIREDNIKIFDLPSWVPHDAWSGFVEMRNKIKKPMTARAKTGIINKLEKFGKENAGAILDQSTESCWQAVYEIKVEAFSFASAPWKVLNNGERVKLDMSKLIVYAENGTKHDIFEVDSNGGVFA